MATVSDSSSSSSTWTDPYKEFELYLEKAHVSFFKIYFISLFFKLLAVTQKEKKIGRQVW